MRRVVQRNLPPRMKEGAAVVWGADINVVKYRLNARGTCQVKRERYRALLKRFESNERFVVGLPDKPEGCCSSVRGGVGTAASKWRVAVRLRHIVADRDRKPANAETK